MALLHKFALTFVLTFSITTLFGQADITFSFENYEHDTLVIGYYYGDRTLVFDTLVRSEDRFALQTEEAIDPGVYMALFRPSNEFIQFLIPKDDQIFEVSYQIGIDKQPHFEGSEDNQLFEEYLTFLRQKQIERDSLKQLLESNPEDTNVTQQMNSLDEMVHNRQQQIVEANPDALTTDLLKSSFQISVPDFEEIENEEDRKMKRYLYYKDHYFDFVDLTKESNLRTPFLNEKIDNYLNKLVPQHPDSIIVAIDFLLGQMEDAEDSYRFYLPHLLNKYANSNVIGFDAIYVHLVKNYYEKGLAPWTSEETMGKLLDSANKLDPILIGKTAPNITLFKQDGSPIAIHDIDSEYVVMIFWAPSCPHCKKAMPSLIEFYEEYNPQGVEVLAICTKHREKVKDCWEMIEEKELPFLNVVDTYHRSNFREVYNIKTTPRVFILDKDKKIILKRVPIEKLDEIMGDLLKEEQTESMPENIIQDK